MKHHVAKVAAICNYHLYDTSARFDVSASKSRLGWCSLDWTIAMQHWPVCPKQLLHHYNVSRTQRLP